MNEDGCGFASLTGGFGKPPGACDGQGRVDAEPARHVVGRRHHASAFALFRVGAYDNREAPQCRVIALLHRSVERVHIDVHDDAHEIQSGTRFSIRPHPLFPLLENDFTGPNSICCVDRNVEKKNREQSLKNRVHRAPPIDGTWLSASNKKPAGKPSPAGYPGSEIDGIDDPGHASRG